MLFYQYNSSVYYLKEIYFTPPLLSVKFEDHGATRQSSVSLQVQNRWFLSRANTIRYKDE